MSDWVRRLRATLRFGALSGALGFGVGATGATLTSLALGTPLLSLLLDWGLGAGLAGFLLGAGFAGALTLAERGRTLEELSTGRAALWGAVSGAVMPALAIMGAAGLGWDSPMTMLELLPVVLGASGSYAALTATLAAGAVRLAKRDTIALPVDPDVHGHALARPE